MPAARAAPASSWFDTDQGRVRLISAATSLDGHDSVMLGLEFQLKPEWKIYWRSPGDAGYPPRLDWAGSENLGSATIAWPAPQRFSVLGLETMGYTDAVVLPITAKVSDPARPLELRAHLEYLTCEKICVPYDADLSLTLAPGSGPAGETGYAALIDQYRARVPGDVSAAGLRLIGSVIEQGARPALLLRVSSTSPLTMPDAFVEGVDSVAFGAPRMEAAGAGESVLRLPIEGAKRAIEELAGKQLTVTLTDGARAMEAATVPQPASPQAMDWAALLPILALALGGGFILNFMPCVLPVLSLKLLAAVHHREQGEGSVRAGFLASAAGIILSFLALGLVAAGFRAAGVYVGWGLQFQQPAFLVLMAVILLLFAANLWGLFTIPLPRAFAAAGEHGAKLGGFFTGVLATLLATPCTAPLLGSALGFALVAPVGEGLLVFVVMGAGLALPYLAVAAAPRLALALPRPGAWMKDLRRVLGVALAVSAAWLIWVLIAELNPAAPVQDALWQNFDEPAIASYVGQGRVVFVDVTADWCLTCKVNEKLVLDTAAVRDRLAKSGIVAMRADWTRADPAIARYLREFGRYGIPFYAVYGPAQPGGAALSEIITPQQVLDALDAAGSRPVPGKAAGG